MRYHQCLLLWSGRAMVRFVSVLAIGFGWQAMGGAAELGSIPEFSLPDIAGHMHTRNDWRDAKAVVVCFLGVECPVSNGYAPAVQRLADKYAERGVMFAGAYSEPKVTADEARKHGAEYALSITRLLDAEQKLATASGVKRVPTFIVVRPDGAIAYRGRIDDRWSPDGRRRDVPRTRELEDAIEAVLAGREPPIVETPTFGCPLQKL